MCQILRMAAFPELSKALCYAAQLTVISACRNCARGTDNPRLGTTVPTSTELPPFCSSAGLPSFVRAVASRFLCVPSGCNHFSSLMLVTNGTIMSRAFTDELAATGDDTIRHTYGVD